MNSIPRPRHHALQSPRPRRLTRRLALACILAVAVGLSLWVSGRILSHGHVKADDPSTHKVVLTLDGAHSAGGSAQTAVTQAQTDAARGADDDVRISSTEEHSEYQGEALQWGPQNLQPTEKACAGSCLANPKCNIWVWCGVETGCAPNDLSLHKACWLKSQPDLDPIKPGGSPGSKGVLWTSGAVYTPHQMRTANEQRADKKRREQARIQALRDNATLPMVFFDVEMKDKPLGRIEFVLFTHTSPLAAENFRALCTGERGVVPSDNVPKREGRGLPYHFKGNYFYRIIDRFIDQAGSNTDAVYGGQFKDEPGALGLKHDRPGLLSLANSGPNTNGGHFSIVVAPSPHLNGNYGIFGEVVSGWDVMYAINAVSAGKKDNTAGREERIKITDSGQLRYGTASAALQANYPDTAAKLIKKPEALYAGTAAS